MPLPKRAIKAFIDRKRVDYRGWKKLSDDQIADKFYSLPVKPPIWYKLMRHQKICLLLGAVNDGRFCFWNDMGTGKSLMAIAIFKYIRTLNKTERLLVLVPNKVNKSEWEQEIRKHTPKTPYCILQGTSAEKWVQLEKTQPGSIIMETYAGLSRMLSVLVECKSRKGGTYNKLVPNRKLLTRMGKLIDAIVADESTALGSTRALPFRLCRQLGKSTKMFVSMSGTPFGRDPIKLWGQMYLVDGGYTLGENKTIFREVFYNRDTNAFGIEYKFNKRKKPLLNRMIANRSIRFDANASDLPQVSHVIKEVSLEHEAVAYFTKAREKLIAARGNYRECKNAFLCMRQISSGFIGFFDDETGNKAKMTFTPNNKLDMLLSLLNELTPENKAIVFHEYIFSGDCISKELDKLGIGYARLWGGTGDVSAVLSSFNNDDNCRVLLLNNAAGAYGLNLQMARYGIYYESPVSVIIRKQTERRFVRQFSQHERVFIYDLVARGTVDRAILEMHELGKDLFEAIVRGERL